MKITRIALATFALALATPLLLSAQNWQGQDHPDHDRGGWDAPPQELREVQRQGFHDGIEAARNDYEKHREFAVEGRDEFRHPPVAHELRDDYRDGFRRGYNVAASHFHASIGTQIMSAVQSALTQDQPGPDRSWDAPPQEFRDIQRQGFHDGIEAGRNDYQMHLDPVVERRREFRHPAVAPQFHEDYRDGFRRGYNAAFSHFREGVGMDHPDHDRGGWDAPPQEFREVQRQGFHDGIEAGRVDFENHYEPVVERRREFRDPPVAPEFREDYRDGFRRGYNAAFSHFHEDHDRR